MYGKPMKKYILWTMLAVLTLTACDKVSPAGILIANTDVDDRILQVFAEAYADVEENVRQAVLFAERVGARETYLIHMSHRAGMHEIMKQTLEKAVYFVATMAKMGVGLKNSSISA